METSGLNHIIMTIKDVKISQAFYSELLGFEVEPLADGFFLRTGGVAIFFFPSGRPIPDDRFSEFRIGLDHLSFNAPSEAALQKLAEQLQAAGVETKGVETYHTGNKYVAFRDPDNIQLEYWLPKQ
ncbi:MAG TPA: VOC family protein [Anaerolineales bacterium]|jgi:catechol 2,3-dioxygenase-like lactoylglutathione lyase family enzyme|nr:VOC family protein [Anaerolineales bacterium]